MPPETDYTYLAGLAIPFVLGLFKSLAALISPKGKDAITALAPYLAQLIGLGLAFWLLPDIETGDKLLRGLIYGATGVGAHGTVRHAAKKLNS